MRIITGSARGRRLESISAGRLRPMLDRVKESLFNIIRGDVPGAAVLDLFSGTGALGLEALSRGAESCIFVESCSPLAELVMRNAGKCGLAERCRVLRADAMELSERRPPTEGAPAGLVFVDPPYAMVDDPNQRAALLTAIEALGGAWISNGAVLALHHRPIHYAVWPVRALQEFDRRIYGQSQLTFFHYVARAEGD